MGFNRYYNVNIMTARTTLAPAEFNVMNATPWLVIPAPGNGYFTRVVNAMGYLNVTTSTLSNPASISLVSYGLITPDIGSPAQGYGPNILQNDTLFSFNASPTNNPPQHIQTLQNFIPSPNLTNDGTNSFSSFFQNNAIYMISTAANMYPLDNQTHLIVYIDYQIIPYIASDFNDN